METFNNDPNFSIVMRAGCNAACAFCFNKDKKRPDSGGLNNFQWATELLKTLEKLPEQFYQISITGGEPMISPSILDVMYICNMMKPRFTNILLTTNGTNLLKYIDVVTAGVHHINVSRHHYDEQTNKAIFGGSYDVTDAELEEIIDKYSAQGVDVSLNCVINDQTSSDFIFNYIEFAKRVGAYAVRFRKENGDSLEPTACEKAIENQYPILERGECPVCRTFKRVMCGLPVYWKAAIIEPTDKVKDKIYELVYDVDGKLYLDWNRNIPYVLEEKPAKPARPKTTYRIVSECGHNSCGWSPRNHC